MAAGNHWPCPSTLTTTTINRDRFPLSPRVKRLRGILAKLGIGSAPAMPYPPPEPPGERRRGGGE
jgi:hypothetical protein